MIRRKFNYYIKKTEIGFVKDSVVLVKKLNGDLTINFSNGEKFKLEKVGTILTYHSPIFEKGKEYFNAKFEDIEPELKKWFGDESTCVTSTEYAHRSTDRKHIGITSVYTLKSQIKSGREKLI